MSDEGVTVFDLTASFGTSNFGWERVGAWRILCSAVFLDASCFVVRRLDEPAQMTSLLFLLDLKRFA